MKLTHLRSFVNAADQSSITGAARKLSLAPSTVSAHIAALENEYGLQLFLRLRDGLRLTEIGRSLVAQAREILDAAAVFEAQARSCRAGATGQVRLALSIAEPLFDLAAFLRHLDCRLPGVELQLSRDESTRILESLEQDKLDMGIVYGADFDPRFFSMPLGCAELVIALPRNWRGKHDSAHEALGNLPWINTGAACPFQQIIEELFAELNIDPPQVLRADDNQTRRQLVAAGFGTSLLERNEAAHPDIAVLDSAPLPCPYSLVALAHRQFDPVIRALFPLVESLTSSPEDPRAGPS